METKLREIVMKNASFKLEAVGDDDKLAGDLGFDSLAFLMTLTDLQEQFDVEFPVERVDELKDISFRQLVRLVTEAVTVGQFTPTS